MQIRSCLILLLFALAGAAGAQPFELGATYEQEVTACYEKSDALAVADIAAKDFERSLELLVAKRQENKCGMYEGRFKVVEVTQHRGNFWVFRIVVGQSSFYAFYMEEDDDAGTRMEA